MKKNNLVIESGDGKEEFDILFRVEVSGKECIIYTKHEQNECGDVIAYAGNYEFSEGKQRIRPVEDDDVLEFLDIILLQIQNKMNGGNISE